MRLLVTDSAAQPPRQATAWLIMTLGKMKTKPHALESLQRGVGAGVMLTIIAMFIFGYLDTSERSPVLILGLPLIVIFFLAYSVLKFLNGRRKIRHLKEMSRDIYSSMVQNATAPKK